MKYQRRHVDSIGDLDVVSWVSFNWKETHASNDSEPKWCRAILLGSFCFRLGAGMLWHVHGKSNGRLYSEITSSVAHMTAMTSSWSLWHPGWKFIWHDIVSISSASGRYWADVNPYTLIFGCVTLVVYDNGFLLWNLNFRESLFITIFISTSDYPCYTRVCKWNENHRAADLERFHPGFHISTPLAYLARTFRYFSYVQSYVAHFHEYNPWHLSKSHTLLCYF